MTRDTRESREEGRGGRPRRPTACVFCNGSLTDRAAAADVARAADLVLAADGGAEHLAALGIRPDAILGDMDSAGGERWSGVPRYCYPSEKNATDTEIAVDYALERGCGRVLLVAALGGRPDHALGNVALAARHPGEVVLVEGAARLLAVGPDRPCRWRARVGSIVSLIPCGRTAAGIRTDGLQYPLSDARLERASHGISNVQVQPEAAVALSEGTVLVYVEHAIDL